LLVDPAAYRFERRTVPIAPEYRARFGGATEQELIVLIVQPPGVNVVIEVPFVAEHEQGWPKFKQCVAEVDRAPVLATEQDLRNLKLDGGRP